MAHRYHVPVDELYAALQEDSEAKRMTAAELMRSLVRDIVLTPEDDELKIGVRGDPLRYRRLPLTLPPAYCRL